MSATQTLAAPSSPSIPAAHLTYRPDIDGLRAVAVLLVVVFHATLRYLPGGYVGVDVFFVISGFLISSIILKELMAGNFSFARFYARRIRRIFPALAAVLAGAWLIGWFLLYKNPIEYATLGMHIAAGAGFLSNILLWRDSGYFDTAAAAKPLLHLWSLGIEEQFYILWPLFLVLFWRRRRAAWLIAAALIASLAASVWQTPRNPVAAFYLPHSRWWELMIGGGLAYVCLYHAGAVSSYRSRNALRNFGSALGLAAIVLAGRLLSKESPFPGRLALIPTLGAALVILAGEGAWVNKSLLARRPMIWVGLISYPLYLWHWPLLFACHTLTTAANIAGARERLAVLGTIALSFLLSQLTYRFLEKPVRFGAAARGAAVTAALCACVAVMGALGYVTSAQGGLRMRYPALLRPFLNFSYEYKASFRNDTCLLSPPEKKFAPECDGNPGAKPGAPRLVIWGDSHGAMYYRALDEAARRRGINVGQFTSSACPPALGFDRPEQPLCHDWNDEAFARLLPLHPHTVILAHDWPLSIDEGMLDKLPETARRLREAGAKRIVLIGPTPHWQGPLSSVLVRYVTTTRAEAVPARMRFGLDDSIPALDRRLEAAASALRIKYVSAYRTLCNTEGCLISIGANSANLTAFDNTHLTAAAARLVIEANTPAFFRDQ
ncbi:MAG: acyltransferase [Elusimicrobia bacterium]|nr:acyltransferase [Elusimicrobiota bacterium]